MLIMRRTLFILLGILFSASAMLCYQAQAAEAPLPPEAQQAFERGIIAAEQEAWELAIINFTETQKYTPKDPRILFCLGLAHSKLGHELAGVAWLRAYLFAAAQVPNAAAIDKEIVRLEAVSEANMKKIFAAAIAAARQVPSAQTRRRHLSYLANCQAVEGDFDGAQKTEQEMTDLWVTLSPKEVKNLGPYFQSSLWGCYIYYLANIGEVQQAQAVLERVKDWELKTSAECDIAKGLTWMGDFAASRDRLAVIEGALDNLKDLCKKDLQKGRYKDSDDPKLRAAQVKLMLELADAYAGNCQLADSGRILRKADEIAEEYKLAAETRSKISAALQKNPNSKKRCLPLSRMDPLQEWIDLAIEMSAHKNVIDLKGELEWAEKETSSDGLADRLATVALQLGDCLNKIHALEKKCAVAAVSSIPAALQPSRESVFQLRLVLDQRSDDSEEMLLVDKSGDASRQDREVLYVEKMPLLDDKAVKSALAVTNKATGESSVNITFTQEGVRQFAQLTRDFIGKRLAIIIDGQLYSAPVIRAEISGGTAEISGGFSEQEAQDLAKKICEALAKGAPK